MRGGVQIVFETHATSEDNEARRASGWHDVALSALGEQQARELGARRRGERFAAIYASDLARSYRTAELAFGDTGIPIVRDARLRECCYGALDGAPAAQVEAEKRNRIDTPFPAGESYRQAVGRMREFLAELARRSAEHTVLIVGHRATQHGLEHWLHGAALEALLREPFRWQPGWTYSLDGRLDP
jgi:2,3-bisphosphoglycerate-dependent phosphoglycerate mutase